MATVKKANEPQAKGTSLSLYDEFIVTSIIKNVRSKIKGVPDSSEVVGIEVGKKIRKNVKVKEEVASEINRHRTFTERGEYLYLLPADKCSNGDAYRASVETIEVGNGITNNVLVINLSEKLDTTKLI